MNKGKAEQYTSRLIILNRWLFALLAFSVPFPLKTPLPVLWMLGLVWLAEIIASMITRKNVALPYQRFTSHGNLFIRISFFALILLYIAGVIYSQNLAAAKFELEKKSLMLLFPLVIFTMNPDVFNRQMIRNTSLGFVAGLMAVTLYLFVNAVLRWMESGNANEFYYSNLALYLHPAYLSLYAVFATGICILLFYHGFLSGKGRWPFLLLILPISWFVIMVALLGSKAGFLSIVILFVWLTVGLLRSQHRKFSLLFLVFFGFVVWATVTMFSDTIMARFNSVRTSTQSGFYHDSLHRADGVVMRLLSWEIALTIFREDPLAGTGTGDYHDRTREITQERGLMFTMGGLKNAHNQYLQTAATLGLPGFVFLLMWMFSPLLSYSYRKREGGLNLLLMALICFNFFWESMLEVQAGVLFFSLFHVLFFVTSQTVKEKPASLNL